MPDTFFSEHFAPTAGQVGTTAAVSEVATLPTRPHMADAGIAGARLRYKKAVIDLGLNFDIDDIARMMTMKSGDRIISLRLSGAGATATTGDIGLYQVGNAHDGPVVDADLYAAAISMITVVRLEAYTEAALIDTDRGRQIWETLGLTENPFVEYDIAITCTASTTTAAGLYILECEYTAGD
jgi:hypothetical protein